MTTKVVFVLLIHGDSHKRNVANVTTTFHHKAVIMTIFCFGISYDRADERPYELCRCFSAAHTPQAATSLARWRVWPTVTTTTVSNQHWHRNVVILTKFSSQDVFTTSDTATLKFDNFRCSQRQKYRQNDISVSVSSEDRVVHRQWPSCIHSKTINHRPYILHRVYIPGINSSPLSAAYMRQWTGLKH